MPEALATFRNDEFASTMIEVGLVKVDYFSIIGTSDEEMWPLGMANVIEPVPFC